MSKCINFSLKLMRYLYRETSNIVLSPISLEITALSIIYSTKGSCYEEIRQVIFDNQISKKNINDAICWTRSLIQDIKSLVDVELKIHNFFYISSKFKLIEQNLDFITHNLYTKVRQVNFDEHSLELYNIIDAEISDTTMGRINQVIKNVPTVSSMLVVNTATLQTEHIATSEQSKQSFISSYEGKFNSTEFDSSMDIFFSIHNGFFKYFKDNEDGYIVVELAYAKNLNLCLILPEEGQSPREILNQMSQHKLSCLFKSFSIEHLEIKIPIIKLKMNIDLAYLWQVIGLEKVFDQDQADFSGLVSNSKELFLESIIFNSELSFQGNFNDKNTSKEKSSSHSKNKSTPLSVTFNRPFIYFITCNIKDQHQRTVIFAGVVNNLIKFN